MKEFEIAAQKDMLDLLPDLKVLASLDFLRFASEAGIPYADQTYLA